MTVDISRKSFDPRRHTAWTTTMQGRVATDAPVNENQAQRDRRVRALLTDLAGRCGYPEILPDSFKIGISGGQLTVAPGRYYVDGHLADNFGSGAAVFDPVLSELRGPTPVLFSAQPYGTGGAPAAASGTHIAYVDVWQRDVTFLEDATILDPGIATDSFARRQTVWQVRTFGPVGAGTTCSTAVPAWDTFTSPSRARLTTRANPAGAINDPCLLPPGALYRGIDNRTYLVAIHGFTGAGAPLIKFSRTNGSVATTILARPQADVLEVAQVAKGDFLRFNPGDWVEVTDEAFEEPGSVGLVVAEGAQEGEHAHAALAGHAGAGGDVLARLLLDVELDPLTAVGVDRALHELVLGQVAEAEPLARLEDDAGAAHELGHDDTLGAVDDERALLGHHREVPHEDRLLLDLARVPVHEPGADEDRRGVGDVLFLALLDGELGRRTQILVVGIELQLELERLGEVLDRADVVERVAQPLVQQPLEGVALNRDQVGQRQGFSNGPE